MNWVRIGVLIFAITVGMVYVSGVSYRYGYHAGVLDSFYNSTRNPHEFLRILEQLLGRYRS